MKPNGPATLYDDLEAWTVSELTRQVKALIDEGFPPLWVTGEISGFKKHPSGHLYFTLKDPQSQLKCMMYRSDAQRQRHPLRDGLAVFARGKLSVYTPKGDYQFYVEQVQPRGLGAREIALRELKEKLNGLGYFAGERKRRLPAFPRRIALVTSPSGAAVRDMVRVLTERWQAVQVWVCPVRVQGDGAGTEVARMIDRLNELRARGTLRIDVLIVGRGGGSIEDLWAFNEEAVAHAIFRSRIPVVSAVGHEIDWTIADLVADVRAATPSAAAAAVVPDAVEVQKVLQETSHRLQEALWRRLDVARSRLGELEARPVLSQPLERIRDLERRLDDWSERLQQIMKQRLAREGHHLEAHAGRLQSLSPLNVLARGYSLTRMEETKAVVRRFDEVKKGDRLLTTLQHGQVVSRVLDVEKPTLFDALPAWQALEKADG